MDSNEQVRAGPALLPLFTVNAGGKAPSRYPRESIKAYLRSSP
jgi:hypothetical protein